jgi:hypothetical protein
MAPADDAFWTAVGAEDPELVRAFAPWARVTDPGALARLLEAGGAAAPAVEAEEGRHPLSAPEDWWAVVLGTGYRATVERLGPGAAERVRAHNLAWIRAHDVREVETGVVYGVARKAGGPGP